MHFTSGLVSVFEYIGVVSFALYGAEAAIQKKMDIFGISVMAFTGACGGGVLRDVIMDVGVPVFFSSYSTILAVLLSVAAVIIYPTLFRTGWVLVTLDAIGLSFFAVDAGLKAINHGYCYTQFVFVAVITAVGGGIMRDIFAHRVPVIFKSDIYALAAAAGVTCMWCAIQPLGENAAVNTALLLIFAIRMLSVYFKINLPIVKRT